MCSAGGNVRFHHKNRFYFVFLLHHTPPLKLVRVGTTGVWRGHAHGRGRPDNVHAQQPPPVGGSKMAPRREGWQGNAMEEGELGEGESDKRLRNGRRRQPERIMSLFGGRRWRRRRMRGGDSIEGRWPACPNHPTLTPSTDTCYSKPHNLWH